MWDPRRTSVMMGRLMASVAALAFAMTAAEAAQVSFYQLPSGAYPHDVSPAPDGKVWYSGQQLGVLGIFDPKTGKGGVYGRVDPKTAKVEAWASPRGRGPYGITVTPKGEVWYASLAGDHIAHVDLDTGAATVVEPPRKGVGPRRIWSDSKGMLWA